MTEDLQNLLDKIKKEGVDKAENEAAGILDSAKAKSEDIVNKAGEEADRIIEKAKKDSESFEEKGRKSLEQAARDVIISARTGIEKTLNSLIKAESARAMDDETLSEMLLKVVDAYCADSNNAEVLVNDEDVEKFKGFMLNKLSEDAQKGINVKPDGSVANGFRIMLKDRNIEHDLTDEAVSEALSRVLRPHIAELLKNTSSEK